MKNWISDRDSPTFLFIVSSVLIMIIRGTRTCHSLQSMVSVMKLGTSQSRMMAWMFLSAARGRGASASRDKKTRRHT